ncbi:MAG: hypothetical protein NZ523_08635 [Elioraea sp.]|nr:hypothetical protein [Elioraea sp.]
MPPLVRFILGHVVVGTAAGWLLLAALLALDVAGLRSLIFTSPDGVLAVGMLALFFAITFGSAASGAAIISLGRQDREGGLRLRFAPLPVASTRAAVLARRRSLAARARGL